MSDDLKNDAVDDWALLQRIRADAQNLCRSSDCLLQPQYRHLLARIEAVIELACFEHWGQAAPTASPPTNEASR